MGRSSWGGGRADYRGGEHRRWRRGPWRLCRTAVGHGDRRCQRRLWLAARDWGWRWWRGLGPAAGDRDRRWQWGSVVAARTRAADGDRRWQRGPGRWRRGPGRLSAGTGGGGDRVGSGDRHWWRWSTWVVRSTGVVAVGEEHSEVCH
ncbi:hypothetical protein GUJ93_ZPchr0004g39775 [Zizania palustris]|uniref:Uncharacterized protein n=1 Tax=Zizania palustris TaxID=103762 RepID=A0A8J5SQG5_ZIZPA|nr:hypothetical protein GUJ93_ZPchr0004g39775 [Zizania palustris]